MDGKVILAGAIAFAPLMAAWMYRYEAYGAYNASHRTDLQAQPLGGTLILRTVKRVSLMPLRFIAGPSPAKGKATVQNHGRPEGTSAWARSAITTLSERKTGDRPPALCPSQALPQPILSQVLDIIQKSMGWGKTTNYFPQAANRALSRPIFPEIWAAPVQKSAFNTAEHR